MGEITETHNSKAAVVLNVVKRIFIYLLAVCLLVAALLFAASKTQGKTIFGFSFYTVLTPSMEPTYGVGSMVFVKSEKAENINVGDVITFLPSSDSEAYLTHRVTQKLVDYEGTGVTCFKTKGDANANEDSFVIDQDRVIGTVRLGIPKLGLIVRFVQLKWYLVLPIVVMIFVFFKLMDMYLASGEEKTESQETSEKSENAATEAPAEQ